MPTIERFEDIKAWQQGRELTREIYRVSRKSAFSKDYPLRDQIRKAAISVTSNIAEGFERNSPAAFSHFLSIAKGSAGEIRSQLYVALDEKYISKAEFEELRAKVREVSQMISGLMTYLEKRQ